MFPFSQISQVWNNTLVNLLKSLYSLGLESSRREMQSVEQEVLWRLRRLTFRQLASLAEFLAVRQGKENRLLHEVIKKLELRWTELEGTRTVVSLMSKVGHISPALMERLEDKVRPLQAPVWVLLGEVSSTKPRRCRRLHSPAPSQSHWCDCVTPQLLLHMSQAVRVPLLGTPPSPPCSQRFLAGSGARRAVRS